MKKLTQRQQSILQYIERKVSEQGYPPSVREIGDAVGLASSSTVHGHLTRLEKKGFIRRDPTKPRAIGLLKSNDYDKKQAAVVQIPLLGKITAGDPITAVENMDEFYPVSQKLLEPNHKYFLLTVYGNSMVNAGIIDGDLVLVKQQSTANNGDIVVAMTSEEEATVKRFYKEANYIRLQPANDQLQPLLLLNVTILGKVVALIRESI